MPRLIRNRTIVDDAYALVHEASTFADLPDGARVIVPLALWRERRGALIARGEAGVWLASTDDPAALADDVDRLPVIAIDFPQFSDGRGYSHARLLRQRYGYRNELRAIGDVQRDQLYYLSQCGFDAFLVPDSRDANEALRGFDDFSDGYQASVLRTPWFARRTPSSRPSTSEAAP
ncbi:MAG TPA: DUF934 domain-containing protein [Casimicrobiaceae bacterium]|nr:DUF934 domain-containing protein [Casimicrobiaceae bacterium]